MAVIPCDGRRIPTRVGKRGVDVDVSVDKVLDASSGRIGVVDSGDTFVVIVGISSSSVDSHIPPEKVIHGRSEHGLHYAG